MRPIQYMDKILIAIFIILTAIFLDGWVDSLRANGVNSMLLDGAPSLISATFIPLAYFVYKRFTIASIDMGIYYCIGLIIYEFFQFVSSIGHFDVIDVSMSFLGLLLIIGLKKFLIAKPWKSHI